MVEERPNSPININDFATQQQEIATQSQKLREFVETRFISPEDNRLIGQAFFGNPTKTATDTNGNSIETEWTMNDILNQMDEMKKDDEKGFKESMTDDLGLGFMEMDRALRETESPLRHQSNDLINFTAVLLHRVTTTTDIVADTYPVHVTEEYRQAEILEAIRRILLQPTYILHEGYGRNGIHAGGYKDGEFWRERQNLITDEMRKAREEDQDNTRYFRLEKERIIKGLRGKDENDWGDLTERISGILLSYIKGAAEDAVAKTSQSLEFYRRLVDNDGKALLSKEDEEAWIEHEAKIGDIRTQIEAIENFGDLLPIIKKNFGDQAGYQDLIQSLFPTKKA